MTLKQKLKKLPGQATLLGTGILSWPAQERRSDRYGTVMLLEDGCTSLSVSSGRVSIKRLRSGLWGCLAVEIVESRKSTHVGDLFHKIYPRQSPAGTWLVLGLGPLFYERDQWGYLNVGIWQGERTPHWLGMRALYDCHEHLVNLIFIERGENPDQLTITE